jgi:hypothetical protein
MYNLKIKVRQVGALIALVVDDEETNPYLHQLHWPFDVILSTEAMARRQGRTYIGVLLFPLHIGFKSRLVQ